MRGGMGDDVYHVDDAGDAIGEAAGSGNDTVFASLAAYRLGAALENLVGTAATGQSLSGNAIANRIDGGAGNDIHQRRGRRGRDGRPRGR